MEVNFAKEDKLFSIIYNSIAVLVQAQALVAPGQNDIAAKAVDVLALQTTVSNLYYYLLYHLVSQLGSRVQQSRNQVHAEHVSHLLKYGCARSRRINLQRGDSWPRIVCYDRIAIALLLSGLPPHPGPQNFKIQVQNITALNTGIHEMD